MLNLLETIHGAGYIYNDLKLENILVGPNDNLPSFALNNKNHPGRSVFKKASIHIIDFGFCTPYIDFKTGNHVPKEQLDAFRGNLLFSSQS